MGKGNRSYIEGMEGARAALQELSKGMARNVGKRALRAPAELLVSRLKARTPVSDSPYDKTRGSLRDGTKVVPSRTEKGRPRVAVLIDDIAAVPIEYGTSKMKARPYVRATVDANRGDAAVAMAAAIKVEADAAIARAVKRGRKK